MTNQRTDEAWETLVESHSAVGGDLRAAFLMGVASKQLVTKGGTEYAYEERDGGLVLQRLDEAHDERYRPRQRGTVTLNDEASFIAYVNQFRGGDSAIFREPGSSKMRAVIDYHQPRRAPEAEPLGGWGEHVAIFEPPFSKSWLAWRRANRAQLTQEAFLELLEERVVDVVKPDYADLVEMIRFFRVNEEIGFSASKNLSNGAVELSYTENPQASGGRDGRLEVPGMIRVRLKPYDDKDAAAEFEARLRYRLKRPGVTFEVRFPEAVEDWLREVDEARAATIREATQLNVYTGARA